MFFIKPNYKLRNWRLLEQNLIFYINNQSKSKSDIEKKVEVFMPFSCK